MKKVVKVSIGNIAFTIEEDGYLILKGYMEELNDHYRPKQSGNEIIDGIEERMSELFIEKAGKDAMITLPSYCAYNFPCASLFLGNSAPISSILQFPFFWRIIHNNSIHYFMDSYSASKDNGA